jgi:hypothetical protein
LPGGACTHWKAPPCHGAHPAADISPFERGNDFHRLRPILTDMTDEQKWICHGNLSI